ncbi:MAG: hypothetical protein AAGF12_12740 [Myxococcota bacterium]
MSRAVVASRAVASRTVVASRIVVRRTALLVGVLLWGCGGATAEPEVPVPEPPPPLVSDPVALLPEHVDLVARVEVRAILNTPYWEALVNWFERLGGGDEGLADIQRFLDQTDQLTAGIAFGERSGDEELFLVLRSPMTEADAKGYLELMAERSNESGPVRAEIRGEDRYLFAEPFSATQVGDLWLVSQAAGLPGMVARRRGSGDPSPRSNPAMTALMDRIRYSEGEIAVAAIVPPVVRAEAAQEQLDLMEGVEEGGLRVEVGNGLAVEVRAMTSDPVQARAIVETLDGQRRQFAGNMMVRMLGLGDILDSIELVTEDREAIGRMAVDQPTTLRLIESLGGLLAAYLSGAAAFGAAPPTLERAPADAVEPQVGRPDTNEDAPSNGVVMMDE